MDNTDQKQAPKPFLTSTSENETVDELVDRIEAEMLKAWQDNK